MIPEQATRRPGELVFSLLLLVFSVAAFWQAYGISGFTGKTTPGVFPMLAAGIMILSGLVILVSAAKALPEPNDAPGFFTQVLSLNHIVLIGLVLGYVLLMPLVGFVISSALFLFGAFQFLWRKNPLAMLALTALTLAVIYVIFREVFQVVLPQGVLMQRYF